jgi:hypothetical protein
MYPFGFFKKKEEIVPHEYGEILDSTLDKIFLSFDKNKSKVGGHEYHNHSKRKTTTVWMEQPSGNKVFCLQMVGDNPDILLAIRKKWTDLTSIDKESLLKSYNCEFSTYVKKTHSQYKLCSTLFEILLKESKERTSRLYRDVRLEKEKKAKEALESFI